MKIWFDNCRIWDCDECGLSNFKIQFAINWYRHAKPYSKKFKPWTGYTFCLLFFKWYITLNYVNDFDAYDRKVNHFSYKYRQEKLEKKDE